MKFMFKAKNKMHRLEKILRSLGWKVSVSFRKDLWACGMKAILRQADSVIYLFAGERPRDNQTRWQVLNRAERDILHNTIFVRWYRHVDGEEESRRIFDVPQECKSVEEFGVQLTLYGLFNSK